MSRRTGWVGAGVLAAAVFAAAPVAAKEYQVAMLDRGPDGAMVFSPGFVKVAPGDTVRFVPRDKGHNAESVTQLTPKGAPTVKGKINEEVVVRFQTPGLYGFKCFPHFGMGMVSLVQVGAATNRADFTKQAQSVPPFAKARLNKYLAQVR
jgi:pseudoazurin